jgi:ribosome biogenesis GTPase
MNIKLGITQEVKQKINLHDDCENIARVTAEHKERYIVSDGENTFNAEITGAMRFSAESSADFPSVGDWVRFVPMDDENVLIIELCERFSKIERQAIAKHGETQVIAANIDFAYIVMAVNQDFNLNRLERYVSICIAGKIEPIVLLTKSDLISKEEGESLSEKVQSRFDNIDVQLLSNQDAESFNILKSTMQKHKTYCFIGSSGVGKSTLVNFLLGQEQMETKELSSSTNKGRHTTSHRELFVLDNGSIVIDTPGMREVGVVTTGEALDTTFDQIAELSQYCKYDDCTHTSESGCAVIEAVESGELEERIYQSYLKLRKEEEYFSSTQADKKRKDKELGKIIKNLNKNRSRYGMKG